MVKIVRKERLNETVTRMDFDAPRIAKKAQPGQFVILRIDEKGERIPLTIADQDPGTGIVTVIFQVVGATTERLNQLNQGDSILDLAGPLGEPSHFDGIQKAAVIGGGLGVAIAFPQAKALFQRGASVDLIVGFRNCDLVILQEEMTQYASNLTIMTDDGSNGNKGFVTDALRKLLESGEHYDEVIAIGPLPMMKAVCDLTRPYGIKTIISMNPIMIDGTGMCGCCRITVGGVTKFACVDGPEFDGHQVDFEETIARSRMFRIEEAQAAEKLHRCNITGEVRRHA